MLDHRYPPTDPRHHGRADNAGFAFVLVIFAALAFGIIAVAMTFDEGRERSWHVFAS